MYLPSYPHLGSLRTFDGHIPVYTVSRFWVQSMTRSLLLMNTLRVWLVAGIVLGLFSSREVMAARAVSFALPDTGLASSLAIDIAAHGGGVWLAGDKGVNYSFDDGTTWLLYDTTNGLLSVNVSAIFSAGGRLWVATSHDTVVQGDLVSASDGLSYTDDDGNTWTWVDFSPSGLNIPRVLGGNRTVFDITGYYDAFRDDDWLFFASFAGGLLASQEGGSSFRRIFASRADSVNFFDDAQELFLRNRVFSCVVDSTHGDSTFLWVGTAAGVLKYIYTVPPDKLYSRVVNALSICRDCPADSAFVYVAGNQGIARGRTTGGPFISRLVPAPPDPGSFITGVAAFGGRVFVGTADPSNGNSAGLRISDDYGESYTPVTFPELVGANRQVREFTTIRNRLYLAGTEAGLWVSADTGQTWNQLYLDSTNITAANRRNVVNALSSLGDVLYAGTDSGFVTWFLSPTGAKDSSRYFVFPDDQITGARVIRVRPQPFNYDPIGGTWDSLAIWTVNRPIGAGRSALARSNDGGLFFINYTETVKRSYDIGFMGDSAFAVGEYGIVISDNGARPRDTVRISDGISTFTNDTVTSVVSVDSTIIFGNHTGLAYSFNRGATYSLFRGNTDTLGADVVVNYTLNNTLNLDDQTYGLTGDFIPALAIQPRAGAPARIWASSRPAAAGGFDGISYGVDTVVLDVNDNPIGFKVRWKAVYGNAICWNFAFNGDTVFAATDAGLLMFCDTCAEPAWDTIPLYDPVDQSAFKDRRAVYAVEVIGNYVWAGSSDGIYRLSLSNLGDQEVFARVDGTTPADEVYAFPVPFAPGRGESVDFHFTVDQPSGATVSVEVYDFAMNKVARPIDNRFFAQGRYTGSTRGVAEWDGHNGKGDVVAVGVYYFKVEYSTGEIRWGKLAVIP